LCFDQFDLEFSASHLLIFSPVRQAMIDDRKAVPAPRIEKVTSFVTLLPS